MVQLDQDKTTQCAVYDQTPDSEQKKINIVVRPTYTVGKVIGDIKTQYRYDKFELVLQPVSGGDLVYLTARQNDLIYKVAGFEPQTKNFLVLLPHGKWDGNVKTRFELAMPSLKLITNGRVAAAPSSTPIHPPPPPPPPLTVAAGPTNENNNIDDKIVKVMNGKHQKHLANGNSIHDIANDDRNALSPPSSMTTVTNATNTDSLNLSPMSEPDLLSDDDLALGASASPTETEPMQCGGPLSLTDEVQTVGSSSRRRMYSSYRGDTSSDAMIEAENKYPLSPLPAASSSIMSATPTNNGYVGLVNQAMTCYLNSLLQALYMTPEFRNALYRWEFDNDNEAKNIPYQLQKLFLNLQVSTSCNIML